MVNIKKTACSLECIPSQRGPIMKNSLSTTKKLVEESVVATCKFKKIIGDDFGENGKNQPRLLFESSVPRGKRPEDTYFFYLHFVWLLA